MATFAKKPQLLTQEGLKKLKAEFEELVKVKRLTVIERVKTAREMGDLTENSEYDAAKEAQAQLETRIVELEKILNNVQLITKTEAKPDFVVIGSTVKVECEGKTDEFAIVGSLEADPSKKKISNESPVGQALLGRKVEELVEVTTSIVRAKYRIIEIK